MREILFRGKRKDNGQWVYGDLITKPVHHDCVILVDGVINHSVIPETVGEYSGMNDKKINRIFEGDILLDQYNDKEYEDGDWKPVIVKLYYQIAFKDGCFGWISELGNFMSFSNNPLPDLEIVGNVHDNPSLTKTEQL